MDIQPPMHPVENKQKKISMQEHHKQKHMVNTLKVETITWQKKSEIFNKILRLPIFGTNFAKKLGSFHISHTAKIQEKKLENSASNIISKE